MTVLCACGALLPMAVVRPSAAEVSATVDGSAGGTSCHHEEAVAAAAAAAVAKAAQTKARVLFTLFAATTAVGMLLPALTPLIKDELYKGDSSAASYFLCELCDESRYRMGRGACGVGCGGWGRVRAWHIGVVLARGGRSCRPSCRPVSFSACELASRGTAVSSRVRVPAHPRVSLAVLRP